MKLYENIFSLIYLNLKGQESVLYDSSGKLKVDTTLMVNKDVFRLLPKIEKNLLPSLYNKIEYPDISIENGIQGLVIIKMTVKPSVSIVESKLIKGVDPWIDKSVLKAIKSIEFRILHELKAINELTFYIPLKFELEKDEFEVNLKKNSAVTKKATLVTLERITTR
ncbi:hypothetical protein DMA11_12100 [Marinilabiliaceae bacterium JC017]|nr:hypothetical protein DMA11_12100 [Marinilabiliaceae bacterium JC017]